MPKSLGINPENQKEIFLNSGRFGPYLKCENKSARIENVEEIFSIGLNRAITLIAEAKPGRISSSMIKDLGEHPEDKKPVRIMKGQYGPYIKYKSLNATIPEEKDPSEITMEEALILIEKRKEYDKNKKNRKKKKMKKIVLLIIISLFINTKSIAKEKTDCSKISKFSPKFLLCKTGKGINKVKSGLKLDKIKNAYNNRPTKGKKTLLEAFKKEKK